MSIRRAASALGAVALAIGALAGCATDVPDRSSDAQALTAQVRHLPGVINAAADTAHRQAQGLVYFRLYVDVSDSVTAGEAAAITTRYLSDTGSGKYAGYRLELDLRRRGNVFAVDSGGTAAVNIDQIVGQSREWTALMHEFPSATVTLRATITHRSGQLSVREAGHSNLAELDFADPGDYTTVSAAARSLSARFPALAGLNWTLDAGKDHPAEIKTSRRLPTDRELDTFNRLNADQSIPHIDLLRINGPVTPPVWFSEKTIGSHDVAVALRLAQAHLPVVATLPAPVLYTAGDQLSGHIGGRGFARGPVAVTVGGCTRHDPLVYVPIPAERQLIAHYETCTS